MEAELPSQYEPGISRIELRRMDLPAPVFGTIIIDPSDQTKLNITFDTDTLPSNTLIETSSRSPLQYGTLDYIINPLNFNVVTTFGTSVNDIPTGTRILLLGILGGFAERIFTVTEKSNRIDTFVKAELVYSHKVYVNGLEVATTNATVDSEYVIYLDAMPNIGDSVRFELFLNEDGADAWKNADNSDFVSDANDIVEWDGSQWNKVFDADQTTTNTYQTNLKTGEQYYWNGKYWVESVDGYYPKGTWRIVL